jgi:hypothetical protein
LKGKFVKTKRIDVNFDSTAPTRRYIGIPALCSISRLRAVEINLSLLTIINSDQPLDAATTQAVLPFMPIQQAQNQDSKKPTDSTATVEQVDSIETKGSFLSLTTSVSTSLHEVS